MTHPTSSTQQKSTWLAAHDAGISAKKLWLQYFSMSGTLDRLEVDAYLHGLSPLPLQERNTIAMAVNELIDELIDTVPPRRRAEILVDSLRTKILSKVT